MKSYRGGGVGGRGVAALLAAVDVSSLPAAEVVLERSESDDGACPPRSPFPSSTCWPSSIAAAP